MKIGHILGHASGTSIGACHFLALRFDDRHGFKPDSGESWILQKVGGTTHLLRGGLGWYTGLWRSPSGKVHVASSAGEVHVNPDPEPRAAPWRVDRLAGTLSGIWGLSDDLVFTWGLRGPGTVMYRYDGARWEEIDSPGEVVGMGGLSPKLIYAVGVNGLIARWDGSRWTKAPPVARGVLSDVFVASDDEMYAVGPSKQLLQGSVHGWTEMLEGPGPMFGVVKWRGEVWVGAAEHGLMKLEGSKLASVKPNIKAEKLDARADLLVSSPGMIAGTADGSAYTATQVPLVEKLLQGHKPAWVK